MFNFLLTEIRSVTEFKSNLVTKSFDTSQVLAIAYVVK